MIRVCSQKASMFRMSLQQFTSHYILGVPTAGIALIVGAQQVEANAWQREEGTSFLSFSIQSTIDGPDYGPYASVYFEYGLSESLTFGIDAGRNLETNEGTSTFFLQLPLPLELGSNLFAAELGIGTADVSGDKHAAFRFGLSWGRPYQARWVNGWLGIDATHAMYESGDHLTKVDATFGVAHTTGSLSLVQLQFAAPSYGTNTIGIAPSFILALSDLAFVELGGVYEIRSSVTSLKLGVWSNF